MPNLRSEVAAMKYSKRRTDERTHPLAEKRQRFSKMIKMTINILRRRWWKTESRRQIKDRTAVPDSRASSSLEPRQTMKWRTALRPSDCGRILIRFEEFHSDEQRHGRLERIPRGEKEGGGGGVEGNGRCQDSRGSEHSFH